MAEGVSSKPKIAGGAANEAPAFALNPPQVSLPKGGGAVRGIGEKFATNPVTGTGSMSVPIALSPGRAGFGPQLSLSYDSGAGNGLFGLGWSLSTPSIRRKTDKGLPTYLDEAEADTFLLAGAEDLVPELGIVASNGESTRVFQDDVRWAGKRFRVFSYRPRIEGLFARIERWVELGSPVNAFWRTISRDNITTWYGRDANSRVFDPADPSRIFEWLICLTHDDKGNAASYRYAADASRDVTASTVWEANRQGAARSSQRYLKRIQYGNMIPFLPAMPANNPESEPTDWLFEAVLDYGDHAELPLDPQALTNPPPSHWLNRPDAFSTHRAGFEIRTYRLCRRVLMFHHFVGETGVGANCLVKATEFDYDIPTQIDKAEQAGYTTLLSATHRSYQRMPGGSTAYESRVLPPVSFGYSKPRVDTTVHTIDPGQLANLPVGTQGPGYRWLDLDGEGLSGVLSEDRGAWYYKPNLGDGRFGATRAVAQAPAMALAAGSGHQFIDLAGDGSIDVVDFSGPAPGFHERDADQGWKRHIPFARLPNINWQDPNLRFVDLTGDGHADALITEGEVFTWYPSLEEQGFDTSHRQYQPTDENSGPRVVFADGTQTIFLADMCGDGLTDLVRIRNGEVCYWPNQGYGRFGRKVTLGNAPRFEAPDLFDPDRIRLTDIDGSGPVDIIYLGRDGARLYFNRSGNSLSNPLTVSLPVATHNLSAVQVADLLGNGTACLVWNSHLPADAARPICYIDLMAGHRPDAQASAAHRLHEKPHLLIEVDNRLGAITTIEYTPSTRFYLQDQRAGTPWVTRLPFPVHCVSKVTVHDKWRKTTFSSTYSYHHGYFDGHEREFRGFGRVEQVDTQAFKEAAVANAASPFFTQDDTLYQAPVKTITWYHTGLAEDRNRILALFEKEYLPERLAADFAAAGFAEPSLPQPVIDAGWGAPLSGDEWREAMRACKGMPLRQEVIELDAKTLEETGKHKVVRLFSAAQHNCHLRRVQPRGANRHAVFLALESESVTCHYELDLTATTLSIDPRIAHTLNLRHDEYGNPQQSIAIGYPRWAPGSFVGLPRPDLIASVQSEWHVSYTETRYTHDALLPARDQDVTSPLRHHRLRLPCEVRTYELTGLDRPAGFYFDIGTLRRHQLCEDQTLYPATGTIAHQQPFTTLQYHQQAPTATPHRRLVEHLRTQYFDDKADGAPPRQPQPNGQLGPRGLKYQDYKLALTDAMLTAVYAGKLDWRVEAPSGAALGPTCRDLLDAPSRSGYVPGTSPGLGGSADEYWIRSGIAGFADDAHQHFFLPERYTDAFGNTTTLQYDLRDLYVKSSRDALGNRVEVVQFDHRVLAPKRMRDANGNCSEVAFDLHGLPGASAVLGKVTTLADNTEITETGDTVASLSFADLNPTPQAVSEFFTRPDFDADTALRWLRKATARFVYHFGEERNANGDVISWGDTAAGACSLLREKHERDLPNIPANRIPLQVAFEYSDGAGQAFVKKVRAEPDPALAAAQQVLRWVTNGKTIVNNKGKPVLQFEPYFSPSGHCFAEPQAFGVSPVMFYDAAGRLVRTDMPDGSFSRVEFTPWFSRRFDANDTAVDPSANPSAHSDWYLRRTDPNHPKFAEFNTPTNQRAAQLAAKHANTPAETHFDSLGREVVAIAHNRSPAPGNDNTTLMERRWPDEFNLTYTRLDAEGKPLWIRDARGNLVMQYITPPKPTRLADQANEVVPAGSAPCYDIAGNLLHQHSMDAGDRWMLMDAAGKPMLAWDLNDKGPGTPMQRRLYRTDYDALHRPVAQWLKLDDAAPAQIESFEYEDTLQYTDADFFVTDRPGLDRAQASNLLGQAVRHRDPSGLAGVQRIDLSGQPAHITRRLIRTDLQGADGVVNWTAGDALLEDPSETFHQTTDFDALGRMTRQFNWHRDLTFGANGSATPSEGATNRVAVYVPAYNARGLLASEWLHVRASKTTTAEGVVAFLPNPDPKRSAQAIRGITYNAKGQKETLRLGESNGNGTTTVYRYDPETFRLTQLTTTRESDRKALQKLAYVYDAVGNITHLHDEAQETVYRRNAAIRPEHDYLYDALYRLIEATGRENTRPPPPSPPPRKEGQWPQGAFPTDHEPRNYTQRYVYDSVGNFIEMAHSADRGSWTRRYQTADDSNRLARTWYGSNAQEAETYRHDAHGSMLNLNRLDIDVLPPNPPNPPITDDERWGRQIKWDWRDMIHRFDAIGGGLAQYHYGIDKQRTRKHITRIGGVVEDRIYLSGYELYRRRNSATGAVVEEIESLHLFEGEQRVLLVDDVITARTRGPDEPKVKEQTLFRYQYGNHLGSVGLELDDTARVISYEEFHPYGTSAFRLLNSAVEAPPNRYRYTGMERDEESGLNYHRSRYLVLCVGSWASSDPSGLQDGVNTYCYCRNSPVCGYDRNGNETKKPKKQGSEGDVNRHGSQKGRGQLDATTNKYSLESEHVDSFAAQRENMRSPETRKSPIPKGRGGTLDRNQSTVLLQKAVSDAKTALDKPVIARAQKEALNGGVSPATAAELGPDAAMARLEAASSSTGRTVPDGAYLAQAGQIDSLHSDPNVRAFTRSPENKIVMTDADIDAALNIRLEEASAGNFLKDIPANNNPRSSTAFKGNFGASKPLAKPLAAVRTAGGVALGGASVGLGLYMTIQSAETGDTAGTVIGATLTSAEATGFTIATVGAVAGDAAVVSVGTTISGVVGFVGLAVGGVGLAIDEGSRAAAGQKTGAVEATEFYAGLVNQGEKEGGAMGALKQVGGWTGGFFSTLIAVGQGYRVH